MKSKRYIMTLAALGLFAAVSAAEPSGAELRKSGADTVVYLPLNTLSSVALRTGSSRSVLGSTVGKYPSVDIRKQFAGLIPGLDVVETDGRSGVTALSDLSAAALYARGQSITYIVDDMPVYISQLQLDPEEIESVTLITDIADKAKFGPQAANGVLYIRTKQGREKSHSLNISFEKGVSVVDRFPEWVNGVDYAKINNYARYSSGLTPYYDGNSLDGFRLCDPENAEYPNVDFRSLMLKDTKPYTRASLQINGGGRAVRYNAHFGYAGEGDIYKMGSVSDFNRLNVRTNVAADITRYLKANVTFFTGMTFRRSPSYGGTSTAADEFTRVMNDLRTIPSIAFPIHVTPMAAGEVEPGGEDGEDGVTGDDEAASRVIYGLSRQWGNNPIAALTENGFYTDKGLTGVVNTTVDYDFSQLLPGLKSTTFLNLNVFTNKRIGKAADYTAHFWDREQGVGEITSHEGVTASNKSLFDKQTYQSLNLYEKLSWDWARSGHALQLSAAYYLSSIARSGKSSYERQQNYIVTGSWSYADKYVVEGVVNCAGSSRLRPGHRYEAFPSAGLGWVMSKEPFMKDVKWVDRLKLRAQVGVLGYEDFGGQYYYEDYYQKSSGPTFGPFAQSQWFGVNTISIDKTSLNRLGNPDLSWEKRKEVSAGVDATLLGGRLDLSLSYFYIKQDGILANMSATIPLSLGLRNTTVYSNYGANRISGLEAAVAWNGQAGDFRYTVGGFLTYSDTKRLKVNEIYAYDYQALRGTPMDAYFGYVYLGKFTSEEEIASSPVQTFDDEIHVGDLKYADLNGDDRIDDNDRMVIGHTSPKLTYAVNVRLAWKRLDLTVIGTGRACFSTPMTNAWFWNGWEDGNYSKFVKNNYGGDYPRIAYYKSNNNFQTSKFWLRDGGFFKIQNVELGYDIPVGARTAKTLKGARIFVRGANLLTFSGIKDVDPESVNSGVTLSPLFRTFTGGLNITF